MKQALIERLDVQIEEALVHLENCKHGTDEYKTAVKEVDELINVRNRHAPKTKINQILNNPPLLNLIGDTFKVIAVLNFERTEILTSKAFNFVKSR